MKVDIDPERLSDVIGKIYDSAVDPKLWPKALEGACGLIGATMGSIGQFDIRKKWMRWDPQWGGDPYWLKLLHEKYGPMMPFFSIMPLFEIGEVASTRDIVTRVGGDEQDFRNSPFFKEWAEPAGLYESLRRS